MVSFFFQKFIFSSLFRIVQVVEKMSRMRSK